MITNLVFDIGNVLVRFEPAEYLAQKLPPELEPEQWVDRIFSSDCWRAGDRGEMSRGQITDTLCRRFPAEAELLRPLLRDCDEMLTAVSDNLDLLRELRAAGFHLYILSNTNPEAWGYMDGRYGFSSRVDGVLTSFAAGCMKPEREIFDILLERFNLVAEDCLFVDDTPENTGTAEALSFHTLTLAAPKRLRRELLSLPALQARLDDRATGETV